MILEIPNTILTPNMSDRRKFIPSYLHEIETAVMLSTWRMYLLNFYQTCWYRFNNTPNTTWERIHLFETLVMSNHFQLYMRSVDIGMNPLLHMNLWAHRYCIEVHCFLVIVAKEASVCRCVDLQKGICMFILRYYLYAVAQASKTILSMWYLVCRLGHQIIDYIASE